METKLHNGRQKTAYNKSTQKRHFNCFRLSERPCFWLLLMLIVTTLGEFPHYVKSSAACDTDSWACTSGQCIESTRICDGRVDCSDRSDETASLCSIHSCPGFAFRCAYGACIPGQAKCNGVSDCADGSDETTSTCRTSASSEVSGIRITISAITFPCDDGQHFVQCLNGNVLCVDFGSNCPSDSSIISTTTVQVSSSSIQRCLPRLPRNLQLFYTSPMMWGRSVFIVYGCPVGWSLPADGQLLTQNMKTNICLGDTWMRPFAVCEHDQRCSSEFLLANSTNSYCEYQRISIPCDAADGMRASTVARFTCRNGYRRPAGPVNDLLVCGESGNWNGTQMICEEMSIAGVATFDWSDIADIR